MPNHITNIIRATGDSMKIQQMLETIKNDDYGIGTIDFNKIMPMPASLDIESGSRTNKGIAAYKDFVYVYTLGETLEKDLLNIPKESEEAFLAARAQSTGKGTITPEEWELGRAAFRNELLYGATTWYDWCIENWGTKWNAYGYDDGVEYGQDNELWLQTAWDAPHPIIEKLAEMYPEISFSHEWADEDIGRNCGRYDYKDGVRVGEYFPEAEKEAIEFAARVMDSDPSDWGLRLNASGNNYVGGLYERYMVIGFCGRPALFTPGKLTDDDIPQGLHCYQLNEQTAEGSASGTVISAVTLDLNNNGYIEVGCDTPIDLSGDGKMTLEDYMDMTLNEQCHRQLGIGGM